MSKSLDAVKQRSAEKTRKRLEEAKQEAIRTGTRFGNIYDPSAPAVEEKPKKAKKSE